MCTVCIDNKVILGATYLNDPKKFETLSYSDAYAIAKIIYNLFQGYPTVVMNKESFAEDKKELFDFIYNTDKKNTDYVMSRECFYHLEGGWIDKFKKITDSSLKFIDKLRNTKELTAVAF